MGIHYIARRRLNVGGRTIEPGEVVPGAGDWRNVKAYVDNGSLAVGMDVPAEAVDNADLKAQLAQLSARVAALEAGQVEPPVGTAPIDGPALPLDVDQTTADPPTDTTMPTDTSAPLEPGDMPGAAAVSPIPALDSNDLGEEQTVAEPAAASPIDVAALEKLSRADLVAKAEELGIADAGRLGSKGAILAAIRERHAAPVSAPEGED